ncbi:MAG: DegV family protein [Clostridiales bacterium]|nr:DegV family protein [Clostridiales bacterium]
MNNKYLLYTDSTCDLTPELYDELDLKRFYLKVNFDGREYKDNGKDIDYKHFYQRMAAGSMPTTVQLNVQQFLDEFTPLLKEGFDILYLAFSSALSGTYNSACIAISELSEQFPERKICVIDSLAACGGEGLYAYCVAKKRLEGASFDELRVWAEKFRYNICHFFTVNDLLHLHRGGRVSKTSAILGTLVGIKPAMYVNNLGELCLGSKVRGRAAALKTLVTKLCECVMDPEDNIIIINQADCEDEANHVADMIRERINIKEIKVLPMGPVIGAHVGLGCMALFAVGYERKW